ncbi:MAG TPA: PBP1A family penicillin-binding protein [Roseiflexaceae bacterium]|nr:PBP1A family penicillin-binding protein [Roseiflexaceae bacterium]
MERTQPGAAPTRARPRLSLVRFAWRLVLAFVKLTLLLAGLALLMALGVYHYYGRDLPDPQQIGRYRPAETSRIYARDGRTLLLELVDPRGGRRTVVPFDKIPQALKDATVAVEDADFYRNPGVDVRGIVRALLQNYEAGEVVSGGSTITQQLVRNVLLPPEERTRITIERKLREAILAFRVSREYSKDQILALYLNEVYYGNRAYGVEAAAQSYFGKHVWELTPAEATLIAGLPQSPTRLNPLTNLEGARERQRVTLDQMVRHGYLAPGQAEAMLHTPLAFVPQETSVLAPHFTFYVRQLLEERYGPEVLYRGGLRIVTSIDLYWQRVAEDIVRQRIREGAPEEGYGPLRERNATNAGAVMLAPNGQILAMVGSVDYHDGSIDGQVNVTLAPRQPGSALKPVVYAAALQRGWTPATVIWDTPVSYPAGGGQTYAPRNYDGQFHGPQRLRMALANSLNIPAVRTLEFVGVEPFVELAHRMGITTLDDPARYGLPLALGAGEVRLLDLANVYTTIRNGGRFRQPVAVLRVTNARGEVLEQAGDDPGHQVLGEHGEQIAYLLTDILSDNVAREYMFGPDNVMELPDGRPAAVKTGTSNEWRDSWAVGFTPDITVGVWVGNSDNAPMQEVAGSNGAGTIWRAIMTAYHAGRPVRAFERPPGISEATICGLTGGPAVEGCPNPIPERFLAGTEPKQGDITLARVRVGGDGTCLAASYTPPDQVREVTFVVYPPEFREWAWAAGAPQPPTTYCPPPAPGLPGAPNTSGAVAQITLPQAGATITATQVLVRGTSRGAYVLDYGAGREPTEWRPIAQGGDVLDGILGVWEAALPHGEYTLRLRVTTVDGVPVEVRAIVRVGP